MSYYNYKITFSYIFFMSFDKALLFTRLIHIHASIYSYAN